MKPILFNTDMVRAILDGRKTVTRRVVKPQPLAEVKTLYRKDDTNFWRTHGADWWYEFRSPCVLGDILWVRETWNRDWCDHYIYKADGGSAKAAGYAAEPKWRPSIHMPKEAARLFLRVTDVRVERLQDITEEQAEQEGSGNLFLEDVAFGREDKYPQIIENGYEGCIKKQFAYLWDSTVKKSDLTLYGWDANPWVWVIDFEQCEKPNMRI